MNTKRLLAAVALAGATLTLTGPAHAAYPTPQTPEEAYKIQRIGRLLVNLTEYMQQCHVLVLTSPVSSQHPNDDDCAPES